MRPAVPMHKNRWVFVASRKRPEANITQLQGGVEGVGCEPSSSGEVRYCVTVSSLLHVTYSLGISSCLMALNTVDALMRFKANVQFQPLPWLLSSSTSISNRHLKLNMPHKNLLIYYFSPNISLFSLSPSQWMTTPFIFSQKKENILPYLTLF